MIVEAHTVRFDSLPLDNGATLTPVEVAYESYGRLNAAKSNAILVLHAFTGDSLFPGGVGNTWKDAANFASLMDDVEQRLFAVLPDSTWVYPGHGKDTTLGAERPELPQWRARGW